TEYLKLNKQKASFRFRSVCWLCRRQLPAKKRNGERQRFAVAENADLRDAEDECAANGLPQHLGIGDNLPVDGSDRIIRLESRLRHRAVPLYIGYAKCRFRLERQPNFGQFEKPKAIAARCGRRPLFSRRAPPIHGGRNANWSLRLARAE